MIRRSFILFTLLLVGLTAPLTARATGEMPVNSYIQTHLGTLGGGFSAGHGINDSGQVVGESHDAANQTRAFLWTNGVMSDLGTLGGAYSSARAINSAGEVVGEAKTAAGITRAFLWHPNTGMRDLGTLGGTDSRALAINDVGQVVGVSAITASESRAFMWKAGTMYNLGTLSGAMSSVATGINAWGQVSGYASDALGNHRAFLWTPAVPNGTSGTMVALPRSQSQAFGINPSADAVGYAPDANGFGLWPCLWDGAGANTLPVVGAVTHPSYWIGYAAQGYANALNASRTVVGTTLYSFDMGDWGYYYEYNAFVWDSVLGVRTLDYLIDPGGTWFSDASAINASGQIVAAGNSAAYLLSPSPLPMRPSNLRLFPHIEDGRASLYWTGSIGDASYTVKRASASGGPYTTLASGVTSANYSDINVANGSRYYYVVSAVNAYGQSANSNEVMATPMPPPDAPTGLTAVPGDQQVTLSWIAGPSQDYYKVFRATTPGGPYVYFNYTYETSLVDVGDWDEFNNYPLVNGTTYYYVVAAVGGAGDSGYSNQASATPVAPPPPSAPTGLTATPGDMLVNLSWNASAGATHYNLWRSTTLGGPYTHHVVNSGGTQWTDSALANGTTYYYVVTAGNNGGASPQSAEASATPFGPPPPAAPRALGATAGKRKVDLKWTQSTSSGVTQNRVYRSTTNGSGYSLRATLSARTSYTETGLTSGVNYYYVVTAVNGNTGKESGYSNQAAVKPR